MGAIQGIFAAQYEVLRANGHSPSEAFNETVEELTQSLMPLVAENGMDWMYANCSTTAQRGALDWWKNSKMLQNLFSKTFIRKLLRVMKLKSPSIPTVKRTTEKN